jgi:hypothetical protein
MEVALETGLIERDVEGRILIHDWEHYQTPSKKAAAKRKRRQRSRQRVEQLSQQDLPFMADNLEESEPGKIALHWMEELQVTDEDRKADLPEWIDYLVRVHQRGVGWEDLWSMVRYILADQGNGQGWTGWRATIQQPSQLLETTRKGDRKYWQVIKAQMGASGTRPSGRFYDSKEEVELKECIVTQKDFEPGGRYYGRKTDFEY